MDDLAAEFERVAMARRLTCGRATCTGTTRAVSTSVVFAVTLDETILEPLVHYYSLEKKTRWTRTVANFAQAMDNPLYRFVRVRHATLEEFLEAIDVRLTVLPGGSASGGS